MAVGQHYTGNQIADVGELALGPYLREYFGEIKAMNDENDAAMAKADGADAADLDKMEIAARERLGQMAESLQEAKSGDFRSTNDLRRDIIRGGVSERNKQRDVSAKMALGQLNLSAKYREQATKEASSLMKRIEVKPDTAQAIKGFASTAQATDRSTDAIAGEISNQLQALINAEDAGEEGDAKHDRMVADTIAEIQRTNPEVAAKVQERMLPASVRDGQTADDWWWEQYSPPTYEKVQADADEEIRRRRGGGASGSMQDDIEWMGGVPEDVWPEEEGASSETSTKRRGGGGSAPSRAGGSVSMEGMSPEAARAYAAAGKEGADPYSAMLAAIEAQQAYVDDIAKRRKEAAAKGPHSRYPRPNPYTVSPNRMVPDDVRKALRSVGNADPGRNEEWTTALRQNGGNVDKAYKAMGGTPERRYGVKDFRPEVFEEEGKGLGEIIAGNLSVADTETYTVAGEGGYTYTVGKGGEISYVSPKDGKTVKVKPGTDAYASISKEIGPRSPIGGALNLFSSLPREVQVLFEKAMIYAEAGDLKAAADAAREVDDDEVRAAFGTALRRASDDPKALAEVINAVSVLPESVTGEWGYAVRALIDEHSETLPKVGARADEVLRGNLDSLAGAMERSGTTRAKRWSREKGERAEREADFAARSEYQAGREAGAEAWQRAEEQDREHQRDYDKTITDALNDEPSDSMLYRRSSARDALKNRRGDSDGFKEGVRMGETGNLGALYQQRTGTIPRLVEYPYTPAPKIDEVGGAFVEGQDDRSALDRRKQWMEQPDTSELDAFESGDTSELDAFEAEP